MNELEVELKTFKKKVTNLELKGVVDKNNIKFIHDFFGGMVEVADPATVDNASISEEFITTSIEDITNAIIELQDTENDNEDIKLLREKLGEIIITHREVQITENAIKRSEVRDKWLEKQVTAQLNKLAFQIIELRVSLGLPISDIKANDIYSYCITLVYDVNNGKYNTLSFTSHIKEDGKISLYK